MCIRLQRRGMWWGRVEFKLPLPYALSPGPKTNEKRNESGMKFDGSQKACHFNCDHLFYQYTIKRKIGCQVIGGPNFGHRIPHPPYAMKNVEYDGRPELKGHVKTKIILNADPNSFVRSKQFNFILYTVLRTHIGTNSPVFGGCAGWLRKCLFALRKMKQKKNNNRKSQQKRQHSFRFALVAVATIGMSMSERVFYVTVQSHREHFMR